MLYDNYRRLCAERGISTARAAKEMGIGSSTIINWRNKCMAGIEVMPRAPVIEKMMTYFGVSREELFNDYVYVPKPKLSDMAGLAILRDKEARENGGR